MVIVEIFVAVLPYTNLTYFESVPDQNISHWAMAHCWAKEKVVELACTMTRGPFLARATVMGGNSLLG